MYHTRLLLRPPLDTVGTFISLSDGHATTGTWCEYASLVGVDMHDSVLFVYSVLIWLPSGTCIIQWCTYYFTMCLTKPKTIGALPNLHMPPWPTKYTIIINDSVYIRMCTYYNIIIISIHAICKHTPPHEQIIHAVECLHM